MTGVQTCALPIYPENAVEESIADDINRHEFKKVFLHYVIYTPIKEESLYRILWAASFLFVFRKNSWIRNSFYFLVVGPPTFYWAFTLHQYPVFYCFLVFCGGLFSDGVILYFSHSDRWQDRLQGTLLPFLTHAEVNLIILSWVYVCM